MSLMERVKSMDKDTKSHWIAFWICLGVSIFLMVGSALVPPPFVIDKSIFEAVAFLLGFSALGQVPALVNSGKTVSVNHGNTSIVVRDEDDDQDVQEQVDE